MQVFNLPRSRSQDKGVVLIVVMIMLVLIGFMSIAVMRGAMNSDQSSNNNRAQMQANEAAQLALRFCEDEIRRGTMIVADAPADASTAMQWTVKDNWVGSTPKAVKVSTDALKTIGNIASTLRQPECLAQHQFTPAGTTAPVVLTARGFSGDYVEDATTRTVTGGSVVWLQSTFLLATAATP